MRVLAAATVALLALAPAVVAADAPSAPTTASEERRANSCDTRAFETTTRNGAVTYTHKAFMVAGPARVGGAVLDWCQSAKNAVIFFYVDDPKGAQHAKCPENMSFAVFPGRGAEAREIIDGNVESYDNPQVKVITPVKTGPTEIAAQGRTIAAYQLEAVVDQNGAPTRKRMIGYARGGDFIRVMTGYVDDGVCSHKTVEAFLAQLVWP